MCWGGVDWYNICVMVCQIKLTAIMKTLCKHDADVDQQDSVLNTAMHYACKLKDKKMQRKVVRICKYILLLLLYVFWYFSYVELFVKNCILILMIIYD